MSTEFLPLYTAEQLLTTSVSQRFQSSVAQHAATVKLSGIKDTGVCSVKLLVSFPLIAF